MELPGYKSTERQLRLFPQEIKSDGELRWAVGEYFENRTATLIGARRYRTDARCEVCPDLGFPDRRLFIECKGVGKTGRAIFYTGRMDKYKQFQAAGNELVHFIWHHNFRASDAGTFDELAAGLQSRTRQVLVIGFPFLCDLCDLFPRRVINSQYNKQYKGNGYQQNNLYGSGWSISLREIRERCFFCGWLGGTVEIFVSSHELRKLIP